MKKITANDFIKVVEWSAEDRCFVGSALPFIGQCCHGKNEFDVYTQLLDIIDDCVTMFKKRGISPKAPVMDKKFNGKILLRTTPERHRTLAIKALEQGDSINQYIQRALFEPAA
jgi:predicted HicB family RNase H-like nuclease